MHVQLMHQNVFEEFRLVRGYLLDYFFGFVLTETLCCVEIFQLALLLLGLLFYLSSFSFGVGVVEVVLRSLCQESCEGHGDCSREHRSDSRQPDQLNVGDRSGKPAQKYKVSEEPVRYPQCAASNVASRADMLVPLGWLRFQTGYLSIAIHLGVVESGWVGYFSPRPSGRPDRLISPQAQR